MKFVIRINPETLKDESFPYLEPGPVPPIVEPEKPEEAKDGGTPETDLKQSRPKDPGAENE